MFTTCIPRDLFEGMPYVMPVALSPPLWKPCQFLASMLMLWTLYSTSAHHCPGQSTIGL